MDTIYKVCFLYVFNCSGAGAERGDLYVEVMGVKGPVG